MHKYVPKLKAPQAKNIAGIAIQGDLDRKIVLSQ